MYYMCITCSIPDIYYIIYVVYHICIMDWPREEKNTNNKIINKTKDVSFGSHTNPGRQQSRLSAIIYTKKKYALFQVNYNIDLNRLAGLLYKSERSFLSMHNIIFIINPSGWLGLGLGLGLQIPDTSNYVPIFVFSSGKMVMHTNGALATDCDYAYNFIRKITEFYRDDIEQGTVDEVPFNRVDIEQGYLLNGLFATDNTKLSCIKLLTSRSELILQP